MDEATLNELLECSVCMEVLDITSKVLPCQHTFCRRCLEAIVAARGGNLHCPECRTPVAGSIDDLPPNVLLVRLLETLKVSAAMKNGTQSLGSAVKHNNRMSKSLVGQQIPSAKALYSYEAREPCDLPFKKGDIILLDKHIDENWFEGHIGNVHGTFPAPYVQVLVPLPDEIPSCRALYDFKVSDGNEKDCLTFQKDDFLAVIRRVDDNWLEGKLGNCIGIFPASFVELNAAGKLLINQQQKNSKLSSDIGGQSAVASRVPAVTSASEVRSSSHHHHQRSSSAELPSHASITNQHRPAIYEALYDYKPLRPDEIELHRGDLYAVLEKCVDGWFKGRNLVTGKLGLFPGNYVRLVTLLSKIISNSNLSNSAAAPAFHHAHVSHIPKFPKTSPLTNRSAVPVRRQPITNVMQARQRNAAAARAAVSGVPGSTHSSPLHVDNSDAAALSALSTADTASGISTWLDVMPSTARVSTHRAFQRSRSHRGHSSTRPASIRLSSCTGQADEAAGPSCITETTHNHNNVETQDRSASERGYKLGIMRRLTVPGRTRKPVPDAEPESNSELQSVSGASSTSTENCDPSSQQPARRDRLRVHRKPDSKHKEMYQCIVHYPPQSEHELELEPGDVITVDRKHANGWYHGKLERTGHTGIFPASFVQRLDTVPSSVD